jgi:hypothetical protein
LRQRNRDERVPWRAQQSRLHSCPRGRIGLGEIAHARRFDGPEWLDPAPSVVVRDVAGFPGMVQGRFQDRQNSVGGGAAPANGIRATLSLSIVLLPALFRPRACSLLGQTVMPIRNLACSQLDNGIASERGQDKRRGRAEDCGVRLGIGRATEALYRRPYITPVQRGRSPPPHLWRR